MPVFRPAFACCLALLMPACDIRSDRPDFRYPEASRASAADWPELAATSDLIAAGQNVQADAQARAQETGQLAERAAALRARAARLRSRTP